MRKKPNNFAFKTNMIVKGVTKMVYIFIAIFGIIAISMAGLSLFRKMDSDFWEKMYRSLEKTANELRKSNQELIKLCEEDLAFAKKTIEDNERALDLIEVLKKENEELINKKEEGS